MSNKNHMAPGPVHALVGRQLSYAAWRFNYWSASGSMTYNAIDAAVERGEIKVGDMPPNPQTSGHAPQEIQ